MQIPIFPLNTVLFPGGVLPLRVFEARYMDMTRECMRKGAPFGVCLIREGREVGAAAVPHTIGCLANIADWDMQQLGLLQLRTVGGRRFRILSQQIAGNGLITAEVELLADEAPALPQSQHSVCVEVLRGIVEEHGAEVFAEPWQFDHASWVGYRLSEVLAIPLAAKQKLMELDDSQARLDVLTHFLQQQVAQPDGDNNSSN